jgi:two-component system, OmpR family, response regulator
MTNPYSPGRICASNARSQWEGAAGGLPNESKVHASFTPFANLLRLVAQTVGGMRILIVEDDQETATYLKAQLEALGHAVACSPDGRDGLLRAVEPGYDVIVLDRMLPDLDGLGVVKRLRSVGTQTPVLFLTNLSGIDDRVEGLAAGGDDYLVKPFAFAEFLARVTALARRPPLGEQKAVLAFADLEMDLIKRTVSRGGEPIELQPREFRLLEYLLRNEGRVVTRKMLLENVWDFHFDPKTNIVETHISRLRAKVDRGRRVDLIHTLRGTGYSLRVVP